MSDFLKWLGNYLPLFLWVIVWLIVLPIRLFFLVLMPMNSSSWKHPMNNLYNFFAFDRG